MKRVGYALLIMLSLGICGVVCQRVAMRGRFAAPYSTYGAGPTGTRAVYALLTELGVPTRRWSEDLAALPAGGMLVALGGCDSTLARPLSRYEQEELERWIGAGGTLLVAGARDYLPPDFGMGFEHAVQCTDDWRSRPAPTDDEEAAQPPRASSQDGGIREADRDTDAGADAVVLVAPDGATEADDGVVWTRPLTAPLDLQEPVPLLRPGTLVLDPFTSHTPLLGVGDVVHATVMERGRGRVVWFASASLFQNRELLQAGGGVIFARLVDAYAAHGPVSFDEYHLGVGEKRSLMGYLRRAGVFPVVSLLAVAVLMFLWRGGARFGAMRRPDVLPPRGTASYVASMASLYARAKDPRGTLQILLRQALRLVARKHRVQVEHDEAEPTRLAAALRAIGQDAAASQVERMTQALSRPRSLCRAAQEIDDAARIATK